jgi:hypothetical protein
VYEPSGTDPSGTEPTGNRVLRYLAILSAARDFGVTQEAIERVVRRFDPFEASPRQLADALADTLGEPRPAS